jgi:hypothetical protein
MESDSNALVVRALLDSANVDRWAIEFNPIRFRGYAAQCANELLDVVQLVACPAGEIDIDGWAGHGRPPGREQKCTLEDESIRGIVERGSRPGPLG